MELIFLIFDLNNCMTSKEEPGMDKNFDVDLFKLDFITVSYTHLTLPTRLPV